MIEDFFEAKRRQFAQRRGQEIYTLGVDIKAFLRSSLILRPLDPHYADSASTTSSLPVVGQSSDYSTIKLPSILITIE